MVKSSAQTRFEGRYLLLKERDGWEFVARHHPVAAIIAWTPSNELVLVEQYRKPIEKPTIEIPAGLIGDVEETAHETMSAAANRELEEETGWRAGHMEEGMMVPTSAGMSSEWVQFFWARDLVKVGLGGGDASENITVHEIHKDQIDAWLMDKYQQGYAIDPKIYAALYWSVT
jgi:ADP-ribose pyrophosphatase